MPASRRLFLQKAAATVVVTAGSIKSWSQQVRELSTAELIGRETINSATGPDWERWIGASFKVTWNGMNVGTLILESVETATFPAPKANQPRGQLMPVIQPIQGTTMVQETETTILLFRTTGKPFIQEVYTLQHDWLGTFNLLLVPGSPPTAGSKYTATITRTTGRKVPME